MFKGIERSFSVHKAGGRTRKKIIKNVMAESMRRQAGRQEEKAPSRLY